MPVEHIPAFDTPGCRKSALLVDDERIVADFCIAVLHQEGFDVDVAINGVQAMQMLAGKRYDLLIIDVRMPLMDGIDLCRYIRDRHPQLVSSIGFISGDVMRRDTLDFLARCGRPFLHKPFTPEELRNLVEAILKTRQPLTLTLPTRDASSLA